METEKSTPITIDTIVNAPVEKAWEFWNNPEHIKNWAFASDGWHAPHAENDLRVDGKFTTTMAAKDGSMSFDFGGTYTSVIVNKLIEYTLEDDRKVKITFEETDGKTHIIETFDPENINTIELQRGGWQAILNNYKKLVESA
ncbi:polyketide cyclase [Pedobacter frigidisoli]|uniref:Polyketide cyclase n=1 Tax=Pedobacter frigidisoli TaxID=2530455 RepID=A0A4R0P8T2_9SPHI|nr:SRPBCC family protein [Pedobacter frigidisoli]TCD12070.1 polyketide cyclase [Pedobacter frigidisoli]